jgi:hypothetical protein
MYRIITTSGSPAYSKFEGTGSKAVEVGIPHDDAQIRCANMNERAEGLGIKARYTVEQL